MKKMITLFILAASMVAQAGQYKEFYKPETLVPSELQDEIVSAIYEKYPCLETLREVETIQKTVKIDQGVIDNYFSTTFQTRYYFDSQHPLNIYIEVESVLWSHSNGKNTSVTNVVASMDELLCN